MNHLMLIKIFFGLRDKSSFYDSLIIITALMLYSINCNSTNYKKLSIENPNELIAIEDSLLKISSTETVYDALSIAHNAIGIKALQDQDFLKAKNHFSRAMSLSKNQTIYLYNYYITEGHLLLKKGNKSGLWDGIEFYYKAASLMPNLGEPYFYIGQSYQKIGNTDFDLIIESYNNALQLTLTDELRGKTNFELNNITERKNRLESFWK